MNKDLSQKPKSSKRRIDTNAIAPEGPLPTWPEAKNGMPTEAEYNQRLNHRLGRVGHLLDAAKPKIATSEDKEIWRTLKVRVSEVKQHENVYSKVDEVKVLEKTVHGWAVNALGVTDEEYNQTFEPYGHSEVMTLRSNVEETRE